MPKTDGTPILRRTLLHILGAGISNVLAAPSIQARPHITHSMTLRDAGLRAGILFGSAFDTNALSDPTYGSLLALHVGILTTDYSMKFGPLRRHDGIANFRNADALVGFARSIGVPLRGHNLIWNEYNPSWVRRLSTAERVAWLDRHIEEVMGRYRGQMHSWDVVNEPFWPQHGIGGHLRDGPWYQAFGATYIKRAFQTARKADPSAKLVLNEAFVERGDARGAIIRKALYELLQDLLNAGHLVDAVGLQCHLRPTQSVDLPAFSDFLSLLAVLPIDVYITEFDVDDGMLGLDGEEVDAAVAKLYYDFARIIRLHPNVKIFSTWQLSDKYSFYQNVYKNKARPLPFDMEFKPKPCYYSLINALTE